MVIMFREVEAPISCTAQMVVFRACSYTAPNGLLVIEYMYHIIFESERLHIFVSMENRGK